MQRRAAAGRNEHVNQAVTAGCVLACKKDCVGVTNYSDVGQGLVIVWPRPYEVTPRVSGRNCRV